jgi:hypothetical protein
MSADRKLLIIGGLVLAALGMIYGLHYALFVEHQTLASMGGALAEAFVSAANRNLPQSHAAVDVYAKTKYAYVRQVDVHSHWIGLGMVLILFGSFFDRVSLPLRARFYVALIFLAGAFLFPLGVLLQTVMNGPLPSMLAVCGSAFVIIALSLSAWGLSRGR